MAPRSITIGVLRESHDGERRVAMVPADAKRLAGRAGVYIEHEAGASAGFEAANLNGAIISVDGDRSVGRQAPQPLLTQREVI